MNIEIYNFGKHQAYRIGIAFYKDVDKRWRLRIDLFCFYIKIQFRESEREKAVNEYFNKSLNKRKIK